jgi:hypothetical protein
MAVTLAGCAALDPLPRPTGGYQAIQLLEPVRVASLLAYLEIGAGTTLVADHALGAVPMYCGMGLMRSFLISESVIVCASYIHGVFTFRTDGALSIPLSLHAVPVQPGAVAEFRLR